MIKKNNLKTAIKITLTSLIASLACTGIIYAATTVGTNISTTGTLTATGLTTMGNASSTLLSVSGTSYIGGTNGLILADGSITDASGAISFGNENLSTTGNLITGNATTTGNLEVQGFLSVDGTYAYPVTTNSGYAKHRSLANETFVEDFQTGHGLSTTGTNCTGSDDGSDFMIGTNSYDVTASAGTTCTVGNVSITSTNLNNAYITLYFKATDYSDISSMRVEISEDTDFADISDYVFDEALLEGEAGTKDGKWLKLTIGKSAMNLTAANEGSILRLRIIVTFTAGSTINLNGLSYTIPATKGAVAFTFDDGSVSDLQAARYMAQYGFVGSSFINSQWIRAGSTPTFENDTMTVAQLSELQKLHNWEIINHGYTHIPAMTSMTVEAAEESIARGRTYLMGNGIHITEGFGYPGGGDSEDIKDLVRAYAPWARDYNSSENIMPETLPPADMYELRTFPVTRLTAESDVTTAMQNAYDNGEFLILTFHDLESTGTGGNADGGSNYCWDSGCGADNFQDIVDYANTNSITVIPIGEMMDKMSGMKQAPLYASNVIGTTLTSRSGNALLNGTVILGDSTTSHGKMEYDGASTGDLTITNTLGVGLADIYVVTNSKTSEFDGATGDLILGANASVQQDANLSTFTSSRAITATEVRDGIVYATVAGTATLPDCTTSNSRVTFIARDAEVLSIAPDTGDIILVNGLSLSVSDELDSGGTARESITLTCVEAATWLATNIVGSWVDGTP